MVPLLAQPPDDVLRHDQAVVDRRVEEDDREDRTSVAGDVVVAAKPGPDLGRDLPQHAVAGPPVEALVDPAEVVGSQQEQDRRPLRLFGQGQARFQLGLELRPVRQPGDRVEERTGERARVGGEGRGHAEEALPPELVAPRVGRRAGIQGNPARGAPGGLALEPHPDPGHEPGAGGPAPAPLRRPGLFVRPQVDPPQRDPAEEAPRGLAQQAGGSLVLVGRLRSRPGVERGGAFGIGELGERIEPAVVDQDLPLPAGPGGT